MFFECGKYFIWKSVVFHLYISNFLFQVNKFWKYKIFLPDFELICILKLKVESRENRLKV